jgi:hypothetical protein
MSIQQAVSSIGIVGDGRHLALSVHADCSYWRSNRGGPGMFATNAGNGRTMGGLGTAYQISIPELGSGSAEAVDAFVLMGRRTRRVDSLGLLAFEQTRAGGHYSPSGQ